MSNKSISVPELGGERKRLDPFVQGVKKGAVKKGVDKVTQKVSLPVAEAINEKLQALHPNMALTAPMVQSGMQAIIVLGFAELLDIAGPHIPSDSLKKADLGARFMREYAGEKVGSDIVDYAAQFLPVIMAAFSEVSEEDLMATLSEEDIEVSNDVSELEENEELEESPIEDLFLEDDDEDEMFTQVEEPEEVKEPEPVVAPVRRRKKRKVVKSSS